LTKFHDPRIKNLFGKYPEPIFYQIWRSLLAMALVIVVGPVLLALKVWNYFYDT